MLFLYTQQHSLRKDLPRYCRRCHLSRGTISACHDWVAWGKPIGMDVREDYMQSICLKRYQLVREGAGVALGDYSIENIWHTLQIGITITGLVGRYIYPFDKCGISIKIAYDINGKGSWCYSKPNSRPHNTICKNIQIIKSTMRFIGI